MARCPKCAEMFTSIRIEEITATNMSGKTFHGVAYQCPHCQTALSVAIDPVSMATDMVDRAVSGVAKLLGRN